jgi:Ca2+:H+ antiporter
MAYALLLFVPLSIALRYLVDATPTWVFLTSVVAIAVLADWIRRATEQLAERAGSTIGGLLNVSFGNTAELVLALFILSQAQTRVVQAQITGSIIGTTLLFLGISALVGGSGAPGRPSTRPAPACCRHCCSWWSLRFCCRRYLTSPNGPLHARWTFL